MRRSTSIACAVLMGSLVVARSAQAAPTVRWHAPAECPADGYVSRQAITLAHSGDEPGDIEAFVTIDRTPSGRYRTSIMTRRGADVGERTVDAATCTEAADAAVVIVAMLFGSTNDAPAPSPAVEAREDAQDAQDAQDAHDAHDAPQVAPSERRTIETAPEPSHAAQREGAREAPTETHTIDAPPRFHVALLGLGDMGSLPRTGLGATLVAGMRVAFARIEASASYLPAQTAKSPDPAKGGKVDLSIASLRAGVPFGAAVEITPAVGLEVGSISGEGFGVRHPMSDSALWLGLAGGASVRWPARERVGMRAGLDAVVPLNRKEFELAGNTVHLAGAVVGRATLGVGVVF